ncbi:Piso0_002836 [Millerozyma farinosa CBS 7064]|uniref:Dolichyldiphosphatase n=1 Tax=Pichia sorbitophila (strain ATCC MYA-4447 / BCRC 22081 / CBS 7064 / NBRC 10061 / NRRL Y-12695) TaxID=559304 RepID=G8YDN0_PICSO|nr:Piso0_002836 [Millerozyma farinosa CBS 7064]
MTLKADDRLVPFNITYILYDPSDIISLACVHLSLLPIYIMVFYTSWFFVSREIEPVVIVGGHLVAELINLLFKRCLRSPRPDFHVSFGSADGILRFGMPSAHAQFMGFFAGYFSSIVLRKINHLSRRQKIAGVFILQALGISVSFSRVYLKYHTTFQVIVGNTLGYTLGIFYYIASSIIRDVGIVDWVLDWPIVKFFYVKDSYYHCYQTYAMEYSNYQNLKARKQNANIKNE